MTADSAAAALDAAGRCAGTPEPAATTTGPPEYGRLDPWRLTEWSALPDVCLIAGCDASDIDLRGPVWLRDGSMHKACTEHWEGIFRVLGEQASWERGDAYRGPCPAGVRAGLEEQR